MAEYIEREALLRDIDRYVGGEESRARFSHWVEIQPAADVRPVARGTWREEMVVGGFAESWESTCSICGKGYRDIGKPHFCPNCGAKMGGEEE